MNAAEARKQRAGSTLFERSTKDSKRAARIKALVRDATIEHVVRGIMERENVSAAELARRLDAKPPQISRDLRGGLSKATISRITLLAQALGYDFIPVFVPQADTEERITLREKYGGGISCAPPARASKKA